jgi:hypothetical protein
MDKRTIFLVFGLLAASAVMAQAYRWVDEDGIVHYSDRPRPGAEQVVLPESNTIAVRRVDSSAAAATSSSQQAAPAAAFRYETLEVAAPRAEETLWNIEGVLNVSLTLSPSLQPGHQVRVYFNGEQREVTGTSFQLQEVYRGVHNIQAEVIDETGTLMIRSQPNRFYVQQNVIGR